MSNVEKNFSNDGAAGASVPAGFASVFGTVKAIVHDPQHRPIRGAQVVVQSRTSQLKQLRHDER